MWWLMVKYFAAFSIRPHGVATSCDFMFWLHCLHVILTDTSLPLEGTVSTVSVTLSKWKREIQTGRSRGTKEWNFLLASCGANLCLPVQQQLCLSWQCSSVSIVIISLVEYCRASTQRARIDLNTVGNT